MTTPTYPALLREAAAAHVEAEQALAARAAAGERVTAALARKDRADAALREYLAASRGIEEGSARPAHGKRAKMVPREVLIGNEPRLAEIAAERGLGPPADEGVVVHTTDPDGLAQAGAKRAARLAGYEGEVCFACGERKLVRSGEKIACDGCGFGRGWGNGPEPPEAEQRQGPHAHDAAAAIGQSAGVSSVPPPAPSTTSAADAPLVLPCYRMGDVVEFLDPADQEIARSAGVMPSFHVNDLASVRTRVKAATGRDLLVHDGRGVGASPAHAGCAETQAGPPPAVVKERQAGQAGKVREPADAAGIEGVCVLPPAARSEPEEPDDAMTSGAGGTAGTLWRSLEGRKLLGHAAFGKPGAVCENANHHLATFREKALACASVASFRVFERALLDALDSLAEPPAPKNPRQRRAKKQAGPAVTAGEAGAPGTGADLPGGVTPAAEAPEATGAPSPPDGPAAPEPAAEAPAAARGEGGLLFPVSPTAAEGGL